MKNAQTHDAEIRSAVVRLSVLLINRMISEGAAAKTPSSWLVHSMFGRAQIAAQINATILREACPSVDAVLGRLSRTHDFSDRRLFAMIGHDVSAEDYSFLMHLGVNTDGFLLSANRCADTRGAPCVMCESTRAKKPYRQISCTSCFAALRLSMGRQPTAGEQRRGMHLLMEDGRIKRFVASARHGARPLAGGITATMKRIAVRINNRR